jgi:hypothetical protein
MKNKLTIKFNSIPELTKTQQSELEMEMTHLLLGYAEFNTIEINDCFVTITDVDENIKNFNSEPSRLNDINEMNGFTLELRKPLFECTECENEFTDKNCYSRDAPEEEITLCSTCYEDIINEILDFHKNE